MRIAPVGDGVRLRLNPAESHALELLFTGLQDDLQPGALAAGAPVSERLYPAGYADEPDARAFRELTEASLREDRSERLDQCLAELLTGRAMLRTEVVLDGEATQRWLRVVNDLRLTLGTRLGVTDDDDYELDEKDPQVRLRARYLWLTALQDSIVVAVMG